MQNDSSSKNLSILLPIYNEAEHVGETLTSILKATENFDFSFEIIIADNCSNDNTLEIVEKTMSSFRSAKAVSEDSYEFINGDIKLIRMTKNFGPEVNFRNSFQASRGDYFLYVGGDDLFPKGSINEAIKKLDNDQRLAAVGFDYFFKTFDGLVRDRQSRALDALLPVRLVNFINAPGANSIYYSIRRRRIHEDWLHIAIPSGFPGHDVVETFHLIVNGRVDYLPGVRFERKPGNSANVQKHIERYKNAFIFGKFFPWNSMKEMFWLTPILCKPLVLPFLCLYWLRLNVKLLFYHFRSS